MLVVRPEEITTTRELVEAVRHLLLELITMEMLKAMEDLTQLLRIQAMRSITMKRFQMAMHHFEVVLLTLMEVEVDRPEVVTVVVAAVPDLAMEEEDTPETRTRQALIDRDIIPEPLADINPILAGQTFPTTGLHTVAEPAVLSS